MRVRAGRTGIKSHEVELDDFDRVFRVNVHGIFLMCKAVLPVMLSQGPKGSGRICNIASISGKEGNAGMLAYSSSKAAVRLHSLVNARRSTPVCLRKPLSYSS